MSKPRYDARGMLPDPQRLADARYIKRDPRTDEISWPPSEMMAQLREAGLVS